jgi:hypothetical protein
VNYTKLVDPSKCDSYTILRYQHITIQKSTGSNDEVLHLLSIFDV